MCNLCVVHRMQDYSRRFRILTESDFGFTLCLKVTLISVFVMLRFLNLFVDTFVNTVPNIVCVVGRICKRFGWEIVCQASYCITFIIELHRRIGQHTYNLLLCFLKQVTIKNDMYGKGNLNGNLVNDIWLSVCWSS
jgi:hypothetical protein